MKTTSVAPCLRTDSTTTAGGAEARKRARSPFEVLRTSGEQQDVDVLRGPRTGVKRHRVASDDHRLNCLLGERLQQLFEVGG